MDNLEQLVGHAIRRRNGVMLHLTTMPRRSLSRANTQTSIVHPVIPTEFTKAHLRIAIPVMLRKTNIMDSLGRIVRDATSLLVGAM